MYSFPDKTRGAVKKRRRRAALQSGLAAACLAREAQWSAERSSALAAEQVQLPNTPALPFLKFILAPVARTGIPAQRRRSMTAFFCENLFPRYIITMPDQAQKNRPVAPGSGGGGDGPSAPKVDKPNTEELLKRMRKVDPDQARRYRQRTGQ